MIRNLSCPGEIIREWLDDGGWHHTDFAHELGISPKHLSQLLNGHVRLTYEMAKAIADKSGIPATLLIGMDYAYWMGDK